MDSKYNKTKFRKITSDLFDKLIITEKEKKKDCLDAISILRNSLHNNSINKNRDFNTIINGKQFTFTKNKPTTATISDIIFLIDFALDIIEEVIKSPEVSRLSSPIPDLFHIEIGYK
jgi:hypothetical protein